MKLVFRIPRQAAADDGAITAPPPLDPFGTWLKRQSPELNWDWHYLRFIREKLDAVTRGDLTRLMIFLPPQHGKSQMCTVRYPVYRLHENPKLRIAVCSYNQQHANRFSRASRGMAMNLFPLSRESYSVREWFTHQGGFLRSVGIGGGLTGTPVDLGIIDDPIKDRQDADSEVRRDNIWDWYTETFYTRLQPKAPIILIQTRWHQDDLAGRILNSPDAKRWEVVSLPAEAKADDPLGRQIGEPLCPARFDAEELQRRRKILGAAYSALYGQDPVAEGGELVKRPGISQLVPYAPVYAIRVRYWDKAATEGAGCYSVGVLMARDNRGVFFVEDVVRGQWSIGQRDDVILATTRLDKSRYGYVQTVVEQEPGSGGLESAQATVKLLAGYHVTLDKVTGDKTLRMCPFASQAEAGNVRTVQSEWTQEWIEELVAFPRGKYRDQADATSGAFNWLSQQATESTIDVGGNDTLQLVNQSF
jgi:predicted phage terminase large subunit-like protein